MTLTAPSLFFGPCKNSACLTACVKATKIIFLFQRLNPFRKAFILSPIDRRNLHHLSKELIRLALVLSTFELAWAVTAALRRETSRSRW